MLVLVTSWTLAAPGMPAHERGRPVTLDLTTVLGLLWSFTRESSMLLFAETALPKFGIRTEGTLGLGFSSPKSRSIHLLAEVLRPTTGLFFSSLVQRDVVFDLNRNDQYDDDDDKEPGVGDDDDDDDDDGKRENLA